MKQLVWITVVMLLFSCGESKDNCDGANLSYNNNIRDIIEASCNNDSCHVGLSGGGWEVIGNFATYDNLLPYLNNGSISSRINSTDPNIRMPPFNFEDRTLTTSDLELLNSWICNGFPEG